MGFFDHIGAAGAGASDALQEMILQRIAEQVQQQQLAQGQQRIDLEGRRFDADQSERAENRRFRQETRDRQDATDLIGNLSPGEITDDQASVLGKSPATKARVTPRTILDARPIGGTAPLDGSGPQSFNVLEPTQEQGERAYQKSERRRIITNLSPRGKMAAEAAEVGVPNAAINELIRDPQQERQERIQALTDEARIEAQFRQPQRAEKPTYIQVTGPDGTLRMMTPEEIRAQGGVATSKGNAPDPAKAEEVRSKVLDLATRLKAHKGTGAFTGSRVMNPSYGFGMTDGPVSGTRAAGAKTLYDSLKAVMTLENLGLLKGVLSDRDMQILQSAGSSLNEAMPDADFMSELDTIIEKVGSSQSGLPPMKPMTSGGNSGGGARIRYDASGKRIQ